MYQKIDYNIFNLIIVSLFYLSCAQKRIHTTQLLNNFKRFAEFITLQIQNNQK